MPDMDAEPSREASPLPIAVDILIEAGGWPDQSGLESIVYQVIGAAMEAIQPVFAEGTELSLVFTDDAHIRDLNLKFRNLDKATNVLSFPAAPVGDAEIGAILGDVVLARETILREAKGGDLTIEAHLAHLILHGFLHLLGYDHEDAAEAKAMERLETGILEGLGIADPYAEQY